MWLTTEFLFTGADMQSQELNKHHQRDWVQPCGSLKYFPDSLSLLNKQFQPNYVRPQHVSRVAEEEAAGSRRGSSSPSRPTDPPFELFYQATS